MTAKTVREIAREAFKDAIEILSIIETLEAGNTPAAEAAVNAARTYAVAGCVRRALWSNLLIIVVRAYASVRRGDQHAQYAFDLLKDRVVRSNVEKRGDPAALADAITQWQICRSDHRRNIIENFRHKHIAHLGSLESPWPIINDIFPFSRATAAALERLAQGTGVVGLSLDSQLMGYRDKANRFWTPSLPSVTI